jgi:hypothetical protein
MYERDQNGNYVKVIHSKAKQIEQQIKRREALLSQRQVSRGHKAKKYKSRNKYSLTKKDEWLLQKISKPDIIYEEEEEELLVTTTTIEVMEPIKYSLPSSPNGTIPVIDERDIEKWTYKPLFE